MEGLNHTIHHEPDALNIVGFRSRLSRPDYFDDTIAIYYQHKQKWAAHFFSATTLPGKPSLLKPMNSKGTAILRPGQYRYKLGLHKGKYEALVQAGPVQVFRDNNTDLLYDLDAATVEEGYFGINIHKASLGAKLVGPNSAGCQVIRDAGPYDELISICRGASSPANRTFTYTLVEI